MEFSIIWSDFRVVTRSILNVSRSGKIEEVCAHIVAYNMLIILLYINKYIKT